MTRVCAVKRASSRGGGGGLHLSTVVYRKEIYSRSASLTFLLHLTVHAPVLKLDPNLPSFNSFSLVPSLSVKVIELCSYSNHVGPNSFTLTL